MTTGLETLTDFHGRTGVVTGASRGIGRATTEMLVRGGADVLGVSRGVGDLGALQKDLTDAPGTLRWVTADLLDPAAPATIRDAVGEQLGTRLDFLVNNAGVLPAGPVTSQSLEDWDRTLGINLRAVGTVSASLHPLLTEGDLPAIVNITSIQAVVGMAGRSVYAASKGGVEALTRQLAVEFAPAGIRVNAVCPGPIRTELSEALFADDEFRVKVENSIPLRRIGTPDDVALAIAFLASRASSYVTGQVLVVDGGRTVS